MPAVCASLLVVVEIQVWRDEVKVWSVELVHIHGERPRTPRGVDNSFGASANNNVHAGEIDITWVAEFSQTLT